MNDFANLATQLAKIGAPIAASLLRSYGGTAGEAAGWLLEQLAGSIGTDPTPEAIVDELVNNPVSVETIRALDQERGEAWVTVYQAGLAGQFALLQSEESGNPWKSAWRWGWMYLLGFFWLWTIILVPLVNAIAKSAIETVQLAELLTLTSWFIALYMGGHTLKELGKNVIDAVRAAKDS